MKRYEEIEIEIVKLSSDDVIATSNPFDGSDDNISNW